MLRLSLQPRTSPRTAVPARELDLISASQRGDISAFNQLVRAYQETAYRLAFHLVDEAAAADEATRSAFESAYKSIRQWKGEELRLWLLRIVVDKCKRGVHFHAPKVSAFAPSPTEMGLASLAPDDRLICVLGDVMGMNDDEISQIAKMPKEIIRTRRSRARSQIRDVLQIASGYGMQAT
jgi:RNA polymerase sigma-70 factor (ECF subfamily)